MLAPSNYLFDEKLALSMLARNAERQGPLDCEIREGTQANWYLVQTFPNETARAMRWLGRRGFGAFRPMEQQVNKKTGQKLAGWQDIFPGWVFVFIWDVGRMRSRLLRCPGVCSLFCYPDTNKPVPVPDAFVQKVRSLSFDHNGTTNRHAVKTVGYTQKRRTPRPDKHKRKILAKLKDRAERDGWLDDEWRHRLNMLEPHQRIALLQIELAKRTAPSTVIHTSGSLRG